MIFPPNRGLVERLVRRLNELAGAPLAEPHHGSMSLERRREVERALQEGRLRAIVATSTLEMGIDIPSVDLVVQIGAPEASSRGLQRVGRAGHQVGATSQGLLLPRSEAELLDAAVVAAAMSEGEVEPMVAPRNPLDVLAQHVLAWALEGPRTEGVLLSRARRAGNFLDLPTDGVRAVVDLLAGRWQGDLSARMPTHLDREGEILSPRRGARLTLVANAGTIPDRGTFSVHLGKGGPRIGELDEEMAYETRPGDVFVLGATSWRMLAHSEDRVVVEPAPGVPGKLPFWRGEGPGRPVPLARRRGALLRALESMAEDEALLWIGRSLPVGPGAPEAMLRWVRAQATASALPTDERVVIERHRDEVGEPRIAILSPWGARVHAPWALAIEAKIEAETGVAVQALWDDDRILLRIADEAKAPPAALLLPAPEQLRGLVLARLHESAWFSGRFRENAARALLLPRRGVERRAPLWQQRVRSRELLAASLRHRDFPIVVETAREALGELFDLATTEDVLRQARARAIRVVEVETDGPSPMAQGLARAYLGDNIYAGDLPALERRARLLASDGGLLDALVPRDAEEGGVDQDILEAVVSELQGLAPGHQARSAEGLLDLLRRIGPLPITAVAGRCEPAVQASSWVDALRTRGQAIVREGPRGPEALAADDLPRWDAAGEADDALTGLVERAARSSLPFDASVMAERLGQARSGVERVLRHLGASGRLRAMAGLRGGVNEASLWVDAELLRRARRRTLLRLRAAIAPVPADAFVRHVLRWQRVGVGNLRDALQALGGQALPWSQWERAILPARCRHWSPQELDALGREGEIAWAGAGALPGRDGRVFFAPREAIGSYVPGGFAVAIGAEAAAVLAVLERRGACFGADLLRHLPGLPITTIDEALRELAWAGRITNDAVSALRLLLRGPSARRQGPAASGRWSRIEREEEAPGAALWRALQRWGVVSRAILQEERLPGGLADAMPLLQEWEREGRVRRGHFVDGLDGAQFALPGAVDALRAARDEEAGPTVLPAIDPALLWGSVLPWPEGRGIRRAAGGWVVLDGGAPALAWEGGRLITWGAPRPETWPLLVRIATWSPGGRLRILSIDGLPPRSGPGVDALRAAGARADHRGLLLFG